jgi:hypothetical protein
MPIDYFGHSRGFSMMDVPKLDSGVVKIDTILTGLLPIGLWAKPKRTRQTATPDQREEPIYFPLPPLIRDIMSDLASQLKQVHYLGPLRSPAKRYYVTNLDGTPTMDPAGEFLPYILKEQREIKVDYAPPDEGGRTTRASLGTALNQWLHYLRTGERSSTALTEESSEIDITSTKNVLLECTLQSFDGGAHALADSGFGYSQVLPILVRGLVARGGSLIAIEQPELHLNPALQVRLVEFLVSLTLAGKAVLIETHSEHVVNAVRVLTVEDESGRLSENARIYYLDTQQGMPTVKDLQIQSDGVVPDWPRQFMGEALSLGARLLRAQQRLITQKSN